MRGTRTCSPSTEGLREVDGRRRGRQVGVGGVSAGRGDRIGDAGSGGQLSDPGLDAPHPGRRPRSSRSQWSRRPPARWRPASAASGLRQRGPASHPRSAPGPASRPRAARMSAPPPAATMIRSDRATFEASAREARWGTGSSCVRSPAPGHSTPGIGSRAAGYAAGPYRSVIGGLTGEPSPSASPR